MANFAILNVKKSSSAGGGVGNHIDRVPGKEFSYRYADPERLHLNKKFTLPNGADKKPLGQAITDRIAQGYTSDRKIRPNAVRQMQNLLSASPEAMQRIQEEGKLKEWVQANYRFMCEFYGEENIVRFNLHMDEATPHIHCVAVPITEDGRLSATEFTGTRGKLKRLQDDYAKAMKQFGLERGLSGTEIKRTETKEWRKDQEIRENVKKHVKKKIAATSENIGIGRINPKKDKKTLVEAISRTVDDVLEDLHIKVDQMDESRLKRLKTANSELSKELESTTGHLRVLQEEIIRNKKDLIRSVLQRVGESLTESQISELVKRSIFRNMPINDLTVSTFASEANDPIKKIAERKERVDRPKKGGMSR